MARFAVVDPADDEGVRHVSNVIEWNPEHAYSAPGGCELVADSEGAAVIGGTWDGSEFGAPDDQASPAQPDPNGLLEAVFDGLGKPKARAIARDYPDITLALQRQRWDLVRAGVDDMLADEFITQQEYDALQGLMTQHNIPGA